MASVQNKDNHNKSEDNHTAGAIDLAIGSSGNQEREPNNVSVNTTKEVNKTAYSELQSDLYSDIPFADSMADSINNPSKDGVAPVSEKNYEQNSKHKTTPDVTTKSVKLGDIIVHETTGDKGARSKELNKASIASKLDNKESNKLSASASKLGDTATEAASDKSCKEKTSMSLICEQCDDEDEPVSAVGYCTHCKEYLCKMCLNHHRRSKSFKHHVLKDNVSLLVEETQDATKETENVPDPKYSCTQHGGENMKYCKSHGRFFCDTCASKLHTQCDLLCIEEEHNNITSQFEALVEQTEMTKATANQNRSTAEKAYVQRRDDIAEFITEIKEKIIRLESEISEESMVLNQDDQENMKAITKQCDKTKQEICTSVEKLTMLKSTNQALELVDALLSAHNQIKLHEANLDKVSQNNNIRPVEFRPNPRLREIMEQMKNIGKLANQDEHAGVDDDIISIMTEASDETDCYAMANDMIGSDEVKTAIKVTHIKDVNVKTSTDSSRMSCRISGSVVLPTGQLVIVDLNNWKIKVVDTNQYSVMAELALSSWPWDITATNVDEVAVTIPKSHCIKIFKISTHAGASKTGPIVATDSLKVKGSCRGICHYNDTLIVTFVKPVKIEVINMQGSVLRNINVHNNANKPLLKSPQNVCISPNGSELYVCDGDAREITCMTLDGNVKAIYSQRALKKPRGVTVLNDEGVVLACGIDSHSIHLIGADNPTMPVLLDNSDGVSYPYSVAICRSSQKLYVTMYNNKVKAFQLE